MEAFQIQKSAEQDRVLKSVPKKVNVHEKAYDEFVGGIKNADTPVGKGYRYMVREGHKIGQTEARELKSAYIALHKAYGKEKADFWAGNFLRPDSEILTPALLLLEQYRLTSREMLSLVNVALKVEGTNEYFKNKTKIEGGNIGAIRYVINSLTLDPKTNSDNVKDFHKAARPVLDKIFGEKGAGEFIQKLDTLRNK